MPYAGDVLVNVTVMLLITVGGIGFLVWDDISTHKFHWKRYDLHTKIVLSVSCILTLGGAALFFLLEGRADADMSWTERVLTSLFDSVTSARPGSTRRTPPRFQTAASCSR